MLLDTQKGVGPYDMPHGLTRSESVASVTRVVTPKRVDERAAGARQAIAATEHTNHLRRFMPALPSLQGVVASDGAWHSEPPRLAGGTRSRIGRWRGERSRPDSWHS